jgi:glycerol uptake facilitator-like aquaporin
MAATDPSEPGCSGYRCRPGRRRRCGLVLANLLFGRAAISIATTTRSGPSLWLAEFVATAGLVLVIAGTTRSSRPERVAFAVGAYISAAYWFTSSTSFANPAVTVARMFSDSFAGIQPASCRRSCLPSSSAAGSDIC